VESEGHHPSESEKLLHLDRVLSSGFSLALFVC
jgi:hypothetical protein